MGKRLALFLNSFHLLQSFLGLKMQKSTFCKKKMVLRVVFFYKIDVQVITNWSVRQEKHQTIETILMVDFLRIFKILHFSNFFEIFEIHQYFMVKLLNALNFI